MGGLFLLLDQTGNDVITGAMLGWGVSLILQGWLPNRQAQDDVKGVIELARYDVIHARLNDIAKAVDVRIVNIDDGLLSVTQARYNQIVTKAGQPDLAVAVANPSAANVFWQTSAND